MTSKVQNTLAVLLVLAASSPTRGEQPPEHLNLVCTTCHSQHPGTQLPIDQACLECHRSSLPVQDAVAGVFHSAADRACSRCHHYHSTELLRATGASFVRPLGDETVLRHCRSCHRIDGELAALSPGHVVAATRFYHVDAATLDGVPMSSVCNRCHEQSSGDPAVPPGTPSFPAHASHPVGRALPASSPWRTSGFRGAIPAQLEMPGGRMECVTCHRLPADTTFRLAPFPTLTDLCNGCHEMSPGSTVPENTRTPAIAAFGDGVDASYLAMFGKSKR